MDHSKKQFTPLLLFNSKIFRNTLTLQMLPKTEVVEQYRSINNYQFCYGGKKNWLFQISISLVNHFLFFDFSRRLGAG